MLTDLALSVRILTEPENSLVKQTIALLSTEQVELTFTEGPTNPSASADVLSLAVDVTGEFGADTLMGVWACAVLSTADKGAAHTSA